VVASIEEQGVKPGPIPLPMMRKEPKVIARIWKGEVPLDRSDEYLERMRTVAIPDYRSTGGNRGAFALRRHHNDRAEFLMVTFWGSLESIEAFAGEDISVAKYYDFDAGVLLEMVPHADHFELYDG
jgi:heme-degrading monooxygenase HmoA